jgi:hypothetical protein
LGAEGKNEVMMLIIGHGPRPSAARKCFLAPSPPAFTRKPLINLGYLMKLSAKKWKEIGVF